MDEIALIMLVDDDSMTTFINKRMLIKAGYTGAIIEFGRAQDALDYLVDPKNTSNIPDIILIDLNMPEMDGWDFLDVYSKINILSKHITIIMLTMSLNPEDQAKSLNYNAIGSFLTKPLTEIQISRIFEIHRSGKN